MTKFVISNRAAKWLFLHKHLLTERSNHSLIEADVLALVRRLGFVQLDSISTVERAHHMILHSRAAGYKHETLSELHQRGTLFEHWTHDASLLPVEFYPHWQHRFRAFKTGFSHDRWSGFETDPQKLLAHVRRRIRKEGALASRAFEDKPRGPWWGWGPYKTALEYLFRTGELAIARRNGFEKVYDLSERVIPSAVRTVKPSRRQTVEWACREALERLGFGSARQIANFFEVINIGEARDWLNSALQKKQVQEVGVTADDGSVYSSFSLPTVEADIASLPPVQSRLRLLSPFDPAIRDRKRALRLFGFDYTIEVFAPAEKRRYGYYVMPILEGNNFIGRIDLKVHRAEKRIEVKGLWPEANVDFDRRRKQGIEAALAELLVFACRSYL